MNDLLNSLHQMQIIDVLFWFVLVCLAVILIASIVRCVIRTWYKFAPKSFACFLFVVGNCMFWYGLIEIISK